MTAAALRTLLSVASYDRGSGLSYEAVARVNDIEYIQALHHIELLSSGRRGKTGAELLVRIQGEIGNARRVRLSEKGEAIMRLFAPELAPEAGIEDVVSVVSRGPLSAFNVVARELPGITLGTLTVLLHIGLRQREFGFWGVPAKTIADSLGISNFSRHLAALGPRPGEEREYNVISMVPNQNDKRVMLPELNANGHRILSTIVAAVLMREFEQPRRLDPDALREMARPEDAPRINDGSDPSLWVKIDTRK